MDEKKNYAWDRNTFADKQKNEAFNTFLRILKSIPKPTAQKIVHGIARRRLNARIHSL